MKQKGRKMSVLQLTMVTAANMLGSGIIMLPTKLAQVGTVSILSWVITALGSMALALTFARCGMFSTKQGGMGGYAEYSFGRTGHFMTNFAYAISIVIANVAIAISAVSYGAEFADINLSPLQICMATMATLWLAVILNFRGTRRTGELSSLTIWGAILPVLGISLIGWIWFDPQTYISAWNPREFPLFEAVGNSVPLTLWAFLGMESAAVNMDAIEDPQKNVPRATMWATFGVAGIYVLSTNAIAGIVPNADLLNSSAPFGLAFATMFDSTIGHLIMGLMVISCFGSLLSWQFTLARVFKNCAEKGFFPKVFGKVTKADAPVKGMLIIVCCQTVLSLMTISPTLSAQFELLANLAVVTNLLPYILASYALRDILRTANATSKERRTYVTISALAIVYCFYALYTVETAALIGGGLAILFGFIAYGIIFELRPAKEIPKEVTH